MEFVLRLDGIEYEVRARGLGPDSTLRQLLADVVEVDGRAVAVGGVVHSADVALREVPLRVGTAVDVGPASDREPGVEPAAPVVFNRPPRSEFPIELPPLDAPAARPDAPSPVRFGWGALVVPLVLGLVMALLFHPRMALFALFSPAMLIANWVEDRRKLRRDRRATSAHLADELAGFERRLIARVDAEARLQARAVPVPRTLLRRVHRVDPRLWERRRHHDDAMVLGLGTACRTWDPVLAAPGAEPAAEVEPMITRLAVLHDVPVRVELRAGTVLGIVGDRARCLGSVRSLVMQAAVLHGPADVEMTFITDRPDVWDWAKWLPHVLADQSNGQRRLAGTVDEAAAVAASIGRTSEPATEAPTRLLIVDLVEASDSMRSVANGALAATARGPGGAIAIAPSVTALPSMCTDIVTIAPDGTARLSSPAIGREVSAITPWHCAAGEARMAARRLAGMVDPEVTRPSATLPEQVGLLELLGLEAPTANAVLARWAASGHGLLQAVVGMAVDGPLVVDLDVDGPHALVAGTTGSGKSELLRTLVASLAVQAGPDEVTFVLVDYKGGSAFDGCAGLPHTVGLVTDLDGHLAQRALTCLEAELRHRERRLRRSGAADVRAFRAMDHDEPLPRLVVVIDEFAALAKELPEFMSSLVDIAQRGRSLGVHLILATQRPHGVINDHIRANTNLRIALRVQDRADSADVIATDAAAGIGRSQVGRAFVRRGPGDVVSFQTARVTGSAAQPSPVRLAPFRFAAEQPVVEPIQDTGGPTNLDLLVAAIDQAAAQAGIAPPRRPWPEPLSGEVDRRPAGSKAALFGVADEPAEQRQSVVCWSPDAGSMLLYGVTGSGTTTALATLAVGLAETYSPDELHLYVLDFDDQLLSPLVTLPHVGAVVAAHERERQLRLLSMLQDEIGRRRAAIGSDLSQASDLPAIVLFVDNYGGFSASFDEPGDLSVKAALGRVVADGPGVGVVTVATAKQAVEVPAQVSSLVASKLLFRLVDRYEYTGLGGPAVDPPDVAGRCFESGSGREIQVARPHPGGIAAAVAAVQHAPGRGAAPRVGTLPEEVKVADIVESTDVFDLEWHVPVGIGDHRLAPAGFDLGEGDHVLVAGPPRSGKSTVLASVAVAVKTRREDSVVLAVCPRRSPLEELPHVDHVWADVALLPELVADIGDRPLVVLVDDATSVDDPDASFADLIRARRAGMHIFASGEADLLRSAYGHWTHELRRSRLGVALRPSPTADGDLWQTTLPRHDMAAWPAGRGILVRGGSTEVVQTARP